MNIIELKDISKSFSGRKVLNQINLSIKKGACRDNGASSFPFFSNISARIPTFFPFDNRFTSIIKTNRQPDIL